MPKKKPKADERAVHGKYTIDSELHRRLRVEAAKQGVSQQQVIRNLLDKHLPKV